MIDINFIKKIFLKNLTAIILVTSALFIIILTSYITRHFDKKDYDKKIKLCETSLQKEKNAQKKYIEQTLQKTQVEDIYVNIEIIKSKQNKKEEINKKEEQKNLNNNTQKTSNNNENTNIYHKDTNINNN